MRSKSCNPQSDKHDHPDYICNPVTGRYVKRKPCKVPRGKTLQEMSRTHICDPITGKWISEAKQDDHGHHQPDSQSEIKNRVTNLPEDISAMIPSFLTPAQRGNLATSSLLDETGGGVIAHDADRCSEIKRMLISSSVRPSDYRFILEEVPLFDHHNDFNNLHDPPNTVYIKGYGGCNYRIRNDHSLFPFSHCHTFSALLGDFCLLMKSFVSKSKTSLNHIFNRCLLKFLHRIQVLIETPEFTVHPVELKRLVDVLEKTRKTVRLNRRLEKVIVYMLIPKLSRTTTYALEVLLKKYQDVPTISTYCKYVLYATEFMLTILTKK